jgi:hypothetical protein
MKSHMSAFALPLLSFLLFLLPACSTTSLTSTWRDPGLTETIHFNKIVALAIHEDGTIRRVVEDEMARQIGPRAVPAYTILTEEDRKEVDRIKARLQAAGVDGAVAMQLLGKRTETTYGGPAGRGSEVYAFPRAESSVTNPYWAIRDNDMPVDDPQTNTILTIDTKIYSVNDAKMIWSATTHTETFTPENVRQIVSDIAKEMRAELQREKLTL